MPSERGWPRTGGELEDLWRSFGRRWPRFGCRRLRVACLLFARCNESEGCRAGAARLGRPVRAGDEAYGAAMV